MLLCCAAAADYGQAAEDQGCGEDLLPCEGVHAWILYVSLKQFNVVKLWLEFAFFDAVDDLYDLVVHRCRA